MIITAKDPFHQNYSYYYTGATDIDLMNQGAEIIMKTRDFTSFSKTGTQTKTNLCSIEEAHWEMVGEKLIFTIRADRFLRNMVRAIVGTLVELGRGKIGVEELQRIIDGKDRSLAGDSVPACGLYLVKVEYPDSVFL